MQLANPLLKNHHPKTNKKDPENAGKLHVKLQRKTAIFKQVFVIIFKHKLMAIFKKIKKKCYKFRIVNFYSTNYLWKIIAENHHKF
jgi:hypothetical protein